MGKKIKFEDVLKFVEYNSECVLLSTEYISINDKMRFQCKCGNEFEATYGKFKDRNKRQCNDCGLEKSKKSNMKDIDSVRLVLKNKGLKMISNAYNGESTIIKVQCGCGEIFERKYSNIRGSQLDIVVCEKCKNKHLSDFCYNIGQTIKDGNKDLTIINRKRITENGATYKKYKYLCNKCGYDCSEYYYKNKYYKEYWAFESNIKKYGCPCCSIPSKYVIPKINSIAIKNPEIVPYFQGGYDEAKMYTRYSNQKIHMICPTCGKITKKCINISSLSDDYNSICDCSKGKSYPEKFMYNILNQLDVEFETQYSPNWASGKLYDFYIPSKNLIIEMDGGLGHGNKIHPKSNKTIEETIYDDMYKDTLAKEHGLKVIRIDCNYPHVNIRFEYIKDNILKSGLFNYFDFKEVNFKECNWLSLKINPIKEICELWNECSDSLTITDMICNYNIKESVSTVKSYILQGVEQGWCKYNPHQEKIKAGLKNRKYSSCCKPVNVYNSEFVLLGTFNSYKEVERMSEDMFGVKLLSSKISSRCVESSPTYRKPYKGFYFNYVGE